MNIIRVLLRRVVLDYIEGNLIFEYFSTTMENPDIWTLIPQSYVACKHNRSGLPCGNDVGVLHPVGRKKLMM